MQRESHRSFIDAVANNENLIENYKKSYQKLLEIKSEIKRLAVDDSLKARKSDLLRYQIDELEKADIKVGERDELMTKRTIITNSQKLMKALNEAYMSIRGGDEFNGASSLLFNAANAMSRVSQYMPDTEKTAQELNDIAYTVDAFSSEISDLIENIAVDEHELADIEERLDLLYRLAQKYGETEEEMLSFLDNARRELYNITYSDEILSRLNEEYKICLAETEEKAAKLSHSRRETASVFEKRIRDELIFLDMPNTVFSIKIEKCPMTENGVDDIEFYISANKGEEPKPLAKIASGGELSRIMLAIKSVLADKDNVDTLIFDEIDAGVSGRAAEKIAEKLCDVSRQKQVICITHLPSIASFADRHMRISKSVRDEKTYTSVTPLDEDGRMAEIARIIGGNETDKAYAGSAKRLLDIARKYKGELQ
ncbi:MAG: DNA repair protein RecN [Clostridiales bacterium]|nr:DNA repair protein RecN [Clostridiales bacterium]